MPNKDNWYTYKQLHAKTNISIRQLKRMAKKENWTAKRIQGDRQTWVQPITLGRETMTKCDKHILAFPYYGGKFSHLPWLLEQLPEGLKKMQYVEPFGGSMALLINKNPSKMEVYNDINSDVVNFFRVLREHKEQLLEKLYMTPYSREEYELAFQKSECDIENARKFYIRIRMSMHALGRSPSQFRVSVKQNSPLTKRIRNSIGDLWEVANRILDVHIENKCALDLIRRYDSENTFFYLDPPYQQKMRVDKKSYRREFYEHSQLESLLQGIRGKFLLSGYGEYNLQLKDKREVECISSRGRGGTKRIEKLWANY